MKSLKRKTAMSVRVRRRNEFLSWFLKKYRTTCYFCGEAIKADEFDAWRDGVTLHHVDQDRSNNQIDNLVIAHRGCHKSWHARNPKPVDTERFLNALNETNVSSNAD